MAQQWKVTSLEVKAPSKLVYANDNMQLEVVVGIKAVIGGGKAHLLSQSELESIELCDSTRPDERISGPWHYSNTATDFGHTYRGNSIEQLTWKEGSQRISFWLSNVKIESKTLFARIRQPDGQTITSNEKGNSSFVAVSGEAPISITKDSLSIDRVDVAGEQINFSGVSWDADNYYVSFKDGRPLHRTDIRGFDATGHLNGFRADSLLANCYMSSFPGKQVTRLLYIRGQNPRIKKTIGTLVNRTNMLGDLSVSATIDVNDRAYALCLTRFAIYIHDIGSLTGVKWKYKTTPFRMFDTFGNVGYFTAESSEDHNLVEIYDSTSEVFDAAVWRWAEPL